ncbi:MAG: hypothetical protein IPP66_03885 [Anaerolineales bacterium]|nr:hypothetical protein [Anaerolineales bacterium]
MPKPSTSPIFNSEIYTKIILNDLVVYSVYTLHKQGLEISSEDIIATCFALFPKRFSMRKYPQYPDSGIVSRRWSDCKSKGYLKGNASQGFELTARGIKRAEKVEKSLGEPLKPVRVEKVKVEKPDASEKEAVHPELKAHAKKYVRSIEMSDAYKHFKKGEPFNEFDFRSMLLCTMESPSTTLARNLNQFKEYVDIHNRKDLSSFLEFCESKFSSLLGIASQQVEKKSSKTKK